MGIPLRQLVIEYPFPPVQIPERMVWTSSSIKLFRKCKRKWFWKYILRLRPKYTDKHLMIGKAFHNTLGEWYKGKRADMQRIVSRYQAALEKQAREEAPYFDQDDYDKLTTMIEMFGGMLMGYAEVYPNDRTEWNIVRDSIEKKFQVNMGEFDYAGKVDLIHALSKKSNRQVEHKTASQIGEGYIDRLSLDTQIRGYVFGASSAVEKGGLGIPVNRVLYDVVKKCKLRRKSNESQDDFNARIRDDYLARPDFYFYREDLMFTKSDIDAFQFEVRQTHQEYVALTQSPEIRKLFGPDHDVMNPRNWTPNDTACNDFFRLCEYHKLCTSGLDRGTAMMYFQNENLNEELADED